MNFTQRDCRAAESTAPASRRQEHQITLIFINVISIVSVLNNFFIFIIKERQSNSRESDNPSPLSPILQHHSKSALSSKSQNVCIDAEFRFPSLSLPDPDMPRRLSASGWFLTLWCNHRLQDRKHNLCVKVSHHKDTWTATRIHIQGKTRPQQKNTRVTHKHNLWEQV